MFNANIVLTIFLGSSGEASLHDIPSDILSYLLDVCFDYLGLCSILKRKLGFYYWKKREWMLGGQKQQMYTTACNLDFSLITSSLCKSTEIWYCFFLTCSIEFTNEVPGPGDFFVRKF